MIKTSTLMTVFVLGLSATRGEAQASFPRSQATPPQAASAVTLTVVSGDDQYWYAGRQLRTSLVFGIEGVTGSECPLVEVTFEPTGEGSVSPESPKPKWDGDACTISLHWRLSDDVGKQHLSATEAGSGVTVTVEALARQGARVFFGGGYTPRQDGHTQFSEDEPGMIEEVGPSAAFRPIIGLDFPLWPEWERIRMAIATGAREFDEFFYFGVSVLQLAIFGVPQEAAPVDAHVGIQLSRRDLAKSGPDCQGVETCSVSKLRFGGIAFMVSIDGSSAFKGLAGAILP